jgi:prevent-host-death family protein
MKKTIGAFEAKMHFSKLIKEVYEDNVEYHITKRGSEIAKLVPIAKSVDDESVRHAIGRLMGITSEVELTQPECDEWVQYRKVGRG